MAFQWAWVPAPSLRTGGGRHSPAAVLRASSLKLLPRTSASLPPPIESMSSSFTIASFLGSLCCKHSYLLSGPYLSPKPSLI